MRVRLEGAIRCGRRWRVFVFLTVFAVLGALLVPLSSSVTGRDTITTIAGRGERSYAGDGGPASEAYLALPMGLALSDAGNLYIADWCNNRIRRVDPEGVIETIAGSGVPKYSHACTLWIGFDGDGGPATDALLNKPEAVAVAEDGSLYIVDWWNYRIRKVSPEGIISTVAGSGPVAPGFGGSSGDGGPATEARISPSDVILDQERNLLIADGGRVRKVDADGIITTIAGGGEPGALGDGGPATEATLGRAEDLALDREGNLYIVDREAHRVRRVDRNGIITTVVGTGVKGYSGDSAPASQARLSSPLAVAVALDGSLYIADGWGSWIRKVSPDGIITTIAGIGQSGYRGDGVSASGAAVEAHDLVLDKDGNLLFAGGWTHRVRKIWAHSPVAAFTATPTEGRLPLTVSFDASGSYDPDGGIASYSWDFGDGTKASGKLVTHTYRSPFSYTVVLTVTDSGGVPASSSKTINVLPQRCKGKEATIVGSPGPDFIIGTAGPDVIVALGGDDRVRAGGGADLVCLGAGDDRASGGSGDDRIYGQAGHDTLTGKRGADLLVGGVGVDHLRGNAGFDQLIGGSGADLLKGGNGPDVLRGNAGADHLFGGRGHDRLIGGRGFDRADGGPGTDICRTEQRTNCP